MLHMNFQGKRSSKHKFRYKNPQGRNPYDCTIAIGAGWAAEAAWEIVINPFINNNEKCQFLLNIDDKMIPLKTKAPPSQNSQEKLSFKMMRERITANTGVM